MSSTAYRVRELAKSYGPNVAFTTEQLLGCGNRNSVDIELCRLVKKGVIKRLTAGMFLFVSGNIEYPSAIEIARIKAERFGKRIAECTRSAFGLLDKSFHTDGCKTSFDSVHGRLRLKHLAPAKFRKQRGAKNNCVASIPSFEEGTNEDLGQSVGSEASLFNDKLEQHALQMAFRLLSLAFELIGHSAPTISNMCYSQVYLG